MDPLDPDGLPLGFVRVDGARRIVDANAFFLDWAESSHLEGRSFDDLLVPTDDFLGVGVGVGVGVGDGLGIMVRPDRPERAAFAIPASDGTTIAIVDATQRYAAGQALREAQQLADRTRVRLQSIIDSSIALAQAADEERLAEILARTAAQSYRAEEATVYLAGKDRRLRWAAGANPFDERFDLGAASAEVLELRQVLKVSGEREAAELSPDLVEHMRATGVQSVIAAPLLLDEEVVGVFICFFHHPRQFDEEATPLAEALAGQAAQSLANLRLRSRLEHAAMHDETTGLPNRRRLDEDVAVFHDGRRLAVMFIDLDGFKLINDRLGHLRGDEVLREVALRLQSSVREDDLVARYGGDEFVVVCEVRDERAVVDVAERLLGALTAPYAAIPADISLGASIGLAVGSIRSNTPSIEGLIRDADHAMYAAKLAGGNQIVGEFFGRAIGT